MNAVRNLPANASYEDVMERLLLLAKAEEGLKQADAGQTVLHKMVKQKMKSSALGRNTSRAEVQAITRHGIWLLVKGRGFMLPFPDYPWFKDAPISAVHNVGLLHDTHLYWPDLDVDIDLISLEHPERFPLIAKRNA